MWIWPCCHAVRTGGAAFVVQWPRPRLKRTGHPQDRKIRDFAEIISAFLATPSPLIRQNLRFRRNFVKHFSIPWNSDKFSSKSARKHVKLIQNSQKMMKFGGKNCKNKNEKLTNIWVWSGAKEWESCRSRKIWKNAPTLAIVAVDTAENEPSKVCPLSVYRSPGDARLNFS